MFANINRRAGRRSMTLGRIRIIRLLLAGFAGIAFAGPGSWQEINDGLDPTSAGTANPLALDANGNLYVGTYNGVFKRSKAQPWVRQSKGLPEQTRVVSLLATSDGRFYAGTESKGLFVSTTGDDWLASNTGIPQFTLVNPPSENTVRAMAEDTSSGVVYAATELAGLYRRGRADAGWSVAGAYANGPYAASIAVDSRSHIAYVGTLDGDVYMTTDLPGYRGWKSATNYVGFPKIKYVPPSVPAVVLGADGSLYAAANYTDMPSTISKPVFSGELFKSSDGGASWTAKHYGLPGHTIDALAVDASGAIYAGTSDCNKTGSGPIVYKSTDGAASWTALGNAFNNTLVTLPSSGCLPGVVAIKSLLAQPDGTLYAATAAGIFQYTPNGPTGAPRLVNVSSRASAQTGDGVVIAGFVISGGNKTVLITGKGPSLAAAGVPNVLVNPKLRLVDSNGVVLASNDDWGSGTAAAGIAATQGAPSDARESALLATLAPGAYTAIMDGVNEGVGNGLIAVDGVGNSSDSGALINLSTRAHVGSGDDVLIAGLIVVDGPRKLLLSARGPSLSAQDVNGVLADPTITLHDASGALLASNDNFGDAVNYADIVATGKAPGDPREAAILQTLQPGAYTLIVRGGGGTQGVALVAVDLVD